MSKAMEVRKEILRQLDIKKSEIVSVPEGWVVMDGKELLDTVSDVSDEHLLAENLALKKSNREMYAELQSLHDDKERLDWLIKYRASVTRLEGEGIATNWFIIAPEELDHLRGTFQTPREAIDAGRKDNP